jgi:hypothetical protein
MKYFSTRGDPEELSFEEVGYMNRIAVLAFTIGILDGHSWIGA